MSADPFAGFADVVEEAPVQRGAVQTSKAGKVGRVDTATTPAVRATSSAAADTAKLAAFLGADPFAGTADLVGAPPAAPRRAPTAESLAARDAQTIQEQTPGTQTSQMVFPRLTAAAREGAPTSIGQDLKNGVWDALTFPGRTMAGVGGLAAGLATGNPRLGFETMQQSMADPQGVSLGEAIVKDPAALPLTALGGPLPAVLGGKSLPFLGRVAAGTGLLTGKDLGDQATDPNAKSITPKSAALDVAKNGGLMLAGEGLGAGLGKFFGQFTPQNVAQWTMKPRAADVEGLHDFAEAGLWPEVASLGASKKEIGEKFLQMYPDQVAQVGQWSQAADAAATQNPALRYKQTQVIDAMEKAFQEAQAMKRGSFSPEDKAKAMDMVLERLGGENPEIMPSAVQQLKSQFGNEGWESNATKGLNEAKAVAFKGVASDMRGFLASNWPQYQPIMDRVQPWVAARSAMEHAAGRGGNNYPLGLLDLEGANLGAKFGPVGMLASGLATKLTLGPNGYLVRDVLEQPARRLFPFAAGEAPNLYPTTRRKSQ